MAAAGRRLRNAVFVNDDCRLIAGSRRILTSYWLLTTSYFF
jgi:hypothetical protein